MQHFKLSSSLGFVILILLDWNSLVDVRISLFLSFEHLWLKRRGSHPECLDLIGLGERTVLEIEKTEFKMHWPVTLFLTRGQTVFLLGKAGVRPVTQHRAAILLAPPYFGKYIRSCHLLFCSSTELVPVGRSLFPPCPLFYSHIKTRTVTRRPDLSLP